MIRLVFYLFATSSPRWLVIFARNPVHSVLWLILAFFNAAGLFLLLGAEFIALLLVIVYVGAVAVLFLFVVMMLDIDFAALRAGFAKLPAVRPAARAGAAGRDRRRGARRWKAGASRSTAGAAPAGADAAQHRGARRAALHPLSCSPFEIAGLSCWSRWSARSC